MKHLLTRPASLISIVFLLLALLHFSPLALPYKLAYPLAFLTLCIGFTVLGALMIVLLRYVVSENIPIIGNFLAEVIHAIEERM